jgi:hypothetical protein
MKPDIFRVYDPDEEVYRGGCAIDQKGMVTSSWGHEKPAWVIEWFTGYICKGGPLYQGDKIKCRMPTVEDWYPARIKFR